ncbi:hypothetical protein [Streptomyces ipomoeae]|uniref:hypothetical protein n=1 Tax=Streptomyces ipomoeae TaxID=103232 RepID=UPI0029BA262E|nr:hypothetical protein [Streptomyces ipomoeae]MDX2698952.1 hypothetical protein [Streptomyces ipomoeae]MDX2844924.1 hypothetical protein [Streptomyces ipomoeae]
MICTFCTERDLAHGGFLCPTCVRVTRDRLTRLPRMWHALQAWLAPGSTTTTAYGRTRLAEAPLPVREEVLDLRAAGGIAGVLEDWREAVHDTRGFTPPILAASLEDRVAIAAAVLDRNLEWIARWYAAPSFADDIQRLAGRVYAVIQPGHDHARPVFLGHCIAVDPFGVICGARLWAHMDRPVACEWCLCPYPPSTWLDLARFQPGNEHLHDEDQDEPDMEPVAA